MYRYNGSRQIFRLDLVQFFYLAVLAPTMFVWGKTFLFFLLRNEVDIKLSVGELFIIDTFFSVIAFFIFSAVAVHSLTKTFWIKRREDPKFDLFHLSEYFHLWWSHIVMFGGVMAVLTLMSFVNFFSPFVGVFERWQIYAVLGGGVLAGVVFYYTIWGSDIKQGNFMRLMKLLMGLFFLIHVVGYFVLDPAFSASMAAYWFDFSMFTTMVAAAMLFERSRRANRLQQWLLHPGWGNNIDIFKKSK